MLPGDLRGLLLKQHYGLVGGHSAIKPCMWLRKSMRGEGFCYKQQFYGIESHRCMQMTPAVGWCTQRCVFCWRNVEHTLGTVMEGWDDPEEVVGSSIEAHRRAVSGFGAHDRKLYLEAMKPKHVAISLAGEPTIYPALGGLIEGFKRRGMTTYLVTNGTLPDRLRVLNPMPTQLYLSVVAPDAATHKKISAPLIAGGWERIMDTVELFPSLSTRKVVRITSVKGWNMRDPRGYARLIGKANPDYVEVKAFMFVGGSRMRLTMDNMPSHDEVKAFAQEIAKETSYRIKDEKKDSRVVLLTR